MEQPNPHGTKWPRLLVLLAAAGCLACAVSAALMQSRIAHVITARFNIGETPTTLISAKSDTVVFGTRAGLIRAVDASGDALWEYTAQNTVLDLAAADALVYASSDDRGVYTFQADGTLLGQFNVKYRPVVFTVSGDGALICVASTLTFDKNELQIFDAVGGILYSGAPETVVNFVFFTAAGEILYVTDDARIMRMNQSGEILGRVTTDATAIAAEFDPESGVLALADKTGRVYAFSESLLPLWSAAGETLPSAVCVADQASIVAVAYENGDIRIFNGQGDLVVTKNVGARVSFASVGEDGDTLWLCGEDGAVVRLSADALAKSAQRVQDFAVLKTAAVLLGAVTLAGGLLLIDRLRRAVFSGFKRFFMSLYRHRLSYLLLAVPLGLLLVFNYYPIVTGLVLAFTDYVPGVSIEFVGFANFVGIFQDPYFWYGFGNMLLLLATDLIKMLVPSIVVAELILALRSRRVQYWMRVSLFLPGILPGVAGLLVWTSGILGMNGLINAILNATGLGYLATSWLGNEQTAIWALIFIGFPWIGSYLIIYGALINLPDSLFDAAKLDGCGWLQRIRHLDIPLVSPQLKYLFVISFIASVQDFSKIYVTTGGGPGHATYTPMLELYLNMSRFQNYGLASAMGLFLFLIIFIATLFNMRARVSSD